VETCQNFFTNAQVQIISNALTVGVTAAVTLGLAYCARILNGWLRWRR